MDFDPWRELVVPEVAAGMRLDRFLARRFEDRSRSFFAARIRAGEVRDAADRPLACSDRVQPGDVLRIHIEGIAPDGPPPPFPPVLYEQGDLVAVDKPAGLLAHPTGTRFVWALISMAKARWNDDRVDLVHRLDRDTSGVLFLTRDLELNRFLKEVVKAGKAHKEYIAIVKGEVDWDERELTGPIGPADGEIRVQMAVREDGLPARTTVTVLDRQPGLTRVRCVLHTGRTHQIRVHLAHAGFPLLGDRLYGVPARVFLDIRERGVTEDTFRATGAPRHALHAARTVVPLPDGRRVEVTAPLAPDLARWWEDPSVLPLDQEAP